MLVSLCGASGPVHAKWGIPQSEKPSEVVGGSTNIYLVGLETDNYIVAAAKVHAILALAWEKAAMSLRLIPAGKNNRFFPIRSSHPKISISVLSIVSFCMPFLYLAVDSKITKRQKCIPITTPRSRNVEPVTTRNIDTRQRRHDLAVRSKWMILVARTDFLACPFSLWFRNNGVNNNNNDKSQPNPSLELKT